jgi:hypothetical protein
MWSRYASLLDQRITKWNLVAVFIGI